MTHDTGSGDEIVDRDAWTKPAVEEVFRGVYRIPLPLPASVLKAVNVYAIIDGDGVVLIDGGWAFPAAEQTLISALSGLGLGFADIRQFLITHVHRDHYSQAVRIRRRFGTTVTIGQDEAPNVELLVAASTRPGEPEPLMFHARALRRAGAHAILDAVGAGMPVEDGPPDSWCEQPDAWLATGSDLTVGGRSMHVLATPGHTRGHVVFRDPAAGLLFAGDHVLPLITPSIGLQPAIPRWPLRDYLDSLRLVRDLPDTRLLPAHGPVTASVHHRVDQLFAHHEERLEAIEKVVLDGAATTYEVADVLRWTRRALRLSELDLFNQILAILETEAHLELLVLRSHLTVSRPDSLVNVYEGAVR